MSIHADEVMKIANLAKLSLHTGEVENYTKELSKILDFVAQMQQVDTNGIAPMAHPLDATQRLREDVVTEDDRHLQFQHIAPHVEAGLYLVTQVIEQA